MKRFHQLRLISTPARPLPARRCNPRTLENTMGKGLLLWLIGIPLPIILLLWAFGYLS
jgi:hypothetical protein